MTKTLSCIAAMCVVLPFIPGAGNAELPLVPERTVAFTATEGTWMSVDVTPDGRRILFDLLGDIYSVPMEGGKAARLVGGMDFAVQPAVSPDGSTVAYVSDRSGSMNLWLLDLRTGRSRQFTREPSGEQIFFGGPEWTPDGDAIAVWTTRRRNWQLGNLPREIRIYDVAAAGEEHQSLTGSGSSSIAGAEYPTFGDDSRRLYYSTFNEVPSPFYGDRVLPEWQLVELDIVSGRKVQLTSHGSHYGGGFAPEASPNGRFIAYGSRFGSDTGLRLLDRQTGTHRWLAYPIDRDQQESNFFYNLPGMTFTPDSSELVVAFGGKIRRIDLSSGKVRTIEFQADVDQKLGALVQPEFGVRDDEIGVRQLRHACPSPDGRTIVFEAWERLWRIDGDGGDPRRLIDRESQQYQATFSPGGGEIVFGDWTEADGGHLYSVAAAGRGTPQRLTNDPGLYYAPEFSRDGKTIFVTRIGGDHPEALEPPVDLLAIPAQGGDAQVIHTLPMMAPDADGLRAMGRPYTIDDDSGRILVNSGESLISLGLPDGDPVGEIASIHGVRRLYTDAAEGLNVLDAASIAPSPSGGRLAVGMGSHVYLVESRGSRQEWGTLSLAEPGSGVAVARLSAAGGRFPCWSEDGDTLLFSLGSTIFRHDADEHGRFSASSRSAIEIDIRRPVRNPQGKTLFENVRILTMNGSEVIDRGFILIDGHRIAAVGEGTLPAPDAHVIDGSGMTVMPGIVDTHAHPDTASHVMMKPTQAWSMLNYLAYGVTTIHDPSQPVSDLVSGDMIATGSAVGPRVLGTGPAIEWSSLAMHMRHSAGESIDSMKQFLTRYADHWRTNTIKEYVSGDRAHRQRLVLAAKDLGLLPVVEGEDHNYNLTHVIDGYGMLGHSMGVAPFYDDVLSLMQAAGTSVQYQFGTLRGEGAPSAMYYFMNVMDPLKDSKTRAFMPTERIHRRLLRRLEFHHTEHAFPLMAEQAAALMRRGVTVSLGDHGEWGGLGDHWEIWAAASAMSNHDALRMATRLGARALGLEKDIGSISPGKLADLIVLDRNPLADIRNTLSIQWIVKNGEILDGETLDRVWPEPRKLEYHRWWQHSAPEGGPGRSGGAPAPEDYFNEANRPKSLH